MLLHLLLHLAAYLGWDTQQINIKTAFLYGLLLEEETNTCINQLHLGNQVNGGLGVEA
jgi:hypothetical protein